MKALSHDKRIRSSKPSIFACGFPLENNPGNNQRSLIFDGCSMDVPWTWAANEAAQLAGSG
jgi:hypothetical protein